MTPLNVAAEKVYECFGRRTNVHPASSKEEGLESEQHQPRVEHDG